MSNQVTHFQIIGTDGAALQRFYQQVFNWEYAPSPAETYKLVRNGGIGGGIGECPERKSSQVTFYVEVDDIDAALENIRRLGGTHVSGPHEVPNGPRIALFQDPQKNVLGLVQSGHC
jgi:predicted enzyme related to lactoylglutathione lyase